MTVGDIKKKEKILRKLKLKQVNLTIVIDFLIQKGEYIIKQLFYVLHVMKKEAIDAVGMKV
ncbi:hypothetical protein MWH30_12420 [Fuchsiella alkaliacetigena]|nr:hypothetical protein [Fuchsiella alkaliacetigena]